MNAKVELSPEEHARLGDELYETRIRGLVERGNEGKVVAIDVTSGDHVVADTSTEATRRLLAIRPNAEVWSVRIGQGWVHRFGVTQA